MSGRRALLVGLVAPLVGLMPAGAHAGATSMTLAAVPAWVAIGSVFELDLALEGDVATADVSISIRERLQSRTAFDQTLDADASLGTTVGSVTVPASSLTPGPVGSHRLRVLLGAPAPAEPSPDPSIPPIAPEPAIDVRQEGVYPVVVDLRGDADTEPLDSFVTYLVALDATADRQPLAVAWIWPMAVDAPRTPDGAVSSALRDGVASSGRLGQMTSALVAGASVPVTVAPRGATLDAWAELSGETDSPAAATLADLRGQVSGANRQVLAGTYAEVQLPALASAGLGGEITAQLAEGADLVRQALGLRPDPRTYFVTGGLDRRSLAALRQAGVDRLVLPRDSLVPIFEQLTPARPFHVVSGSRSFVSAAADPVISELLDSASGSDAQTAQQFLAALTLVAFESPSATRGVVVAPRQEWAPSARLLGAAMQGLAGHPVLSPMTLDTFYDEVPLAEGEADERTLGAPDETRSALSADEIEAARLRITSLTTMLDESAPEPLAARRRLLLAEAAPFQRRGADPSASDYLAGVDGIIASVTGALRLPETPSVTLTARRGRVPITLVNDFARPLDVTLRFRSDNLLFPDGEERSFTLPPRSTTTQITVEARTSGVFPMIVEVTSPDGRLVVGSFEMRIRSTAVSGVALAITVGAGLFLVGWWGNHVRTARQRARGEGGE